MKIPSIDQAEMMLAEGEQRNPGPWGDHSRQTALCARRIAEQCPSLEADAAYVLGLMHDIGRREGFSHIKHIWDGHQFMMQNGWDDAAAICLSHSFPMPDFNQYVGKIDITAEQYRFIHGFIKQRAYTDYDKLIQLCDAIAMAEGAVLIEKRLMDVVLRHGVIPEGSLDKWRKTIELKQYFDALAGENVYRLMPGIVDNTFGW